VKEKRKGPIGRAAGIAEGLAATVRRMQREREPRVLVYDETGYARLVQPDGRGYERLLETAERMVALVDEAEAAAKAKPRRAAARGDGADTVGEAEAKPRRARREKAGGKAKAGRAEPAGEAGSKPRRAKAAGKAKPGRAEPGTKPRRAKTGESGAKPRGARRTEAAGAKPRRTRRARREDDG
jgi:hypothetical protein